MYKKILVPLDGSKLAEQVLPYTARLAKAYGAQVMLIGVCEPEESDYKHTCELYIFSEASKLADMAGSTHIDIQTVVSTGKAYEEILGNAAEKEVDLILMTSHGRGGFMPWTLGSTVTRVMQRAKLPLLIIRASEKKIVKEEETFANVLVPLSGSEDSTEILPHIRDMAATLQSKCTLLQVVKPGTHVHTIGGLNYIPYKDIDLNQRKKSAEEYLKTAAAIFEGSSVSPNIEVIIGEPAPEIIKYANKNRVSLIAIVSHIHSGVEAWMHGKVTHKLLNGSDQAILLLPGEES